ncbi:MAG: hypothetical protein AAFV53_10005 [Myxococcota bacterium]
MRIGIDIGRVIISAAGNDGLSDTVFIDGGDEAAMQTPPEPGAIETITTLVALSRGNAWLVSKAGPRIQARSRAWLHHIDFFTRTGIPEQHLRFCRERRDKAVHARTLKLTHFIDDRIGVHQHLRDLVPNLYLFGHQKPRTQVPNWLTPARDWAAIAELLLPDKSR